MMIPVMMMVITDDTNDKDLLDDDPNKGDKDG